MKAFLKNLYSSKLFPLCWTLFTITLLCLPGSVIPGAGVFAINGLDKIVHFILFGGIVLLWGLYVRKTYPYAVWFKKMLIAALFSILLGVALEYVQRYFIPGRSFDVKDIVADAVGAVTIFLLLISTGRKKPL